MKNKLKRHPLNKAAYLVARNIVSDTTSELGWYWSNCKIRPEDLNVNSLATVALPWLIEKRLRVQELYKAWHLAVKKAHAARIGQYIRNPSAYVVACWEEELRLLCKGDPQKLPEPKSKLTQANE